MEGKAPSATKDVQASQFPSWNQYLSQLGDYAQTIIPTLGKPYSGELTAPMNSQQNQSYSGLNNYLSGATPYTQGPQYQAANQQIMDTLSGKYLGQQSPYELAVNNQLLTQQYPEMQNTLNQQLARRGTFSTGYGGQMQEKLNTDVMAQLATNRGAQYNIERKNQLNAVSPAMTSAQTMYQAPIDQLSQLLGVGNQIQQQQQTVDTNAYNEFNRQRQEQLGAMTPSSTASSLGSMLLSPDKYDYSMTPGKASAFSSYIAPAIQLAGLAGAGFTGGASIPIANKIAGLGNSASQNYGANSGNFANLTGAFSGLAGSAYGGGSGGMSDFFTNLMYGQGAAQDNQLANYMMGSMNY